MSKFLGWFPLHCHAGQSEASSHSWVWKSKVSQFFIGETVKTVRGDDYMVDEADVAC